jgi:hypothetical protein
MTDLLLKTPFAKLSDEEFTTVSEKVRKEQKKEDVSVDRPLAKERKVVWTAAELLATEFPPVQWIIPNLIAPGLTVLAGSPKLGKSFLALSWALSVSSGGYALGKVPTQKAAVLYLSLEDTPRRLQSRLQKLNAENLDNLHFITAWNKKPSDLFGYLQKHPEIRFCVIDTWGRFARVSDFNDYGENTNKAAELKKIADDLDVALLIIHHARKSGKNDSGDFQDSILGSTGLAGAADSTIVLRRGRGNRQAELLATGRDISEQELVLNFSEDCGWTLVGNKSEIQETDARQAIFDWLNDNGPHTPKAIHKAMTEEGEQRSPVTVRRLLSNMVRDGILDNSKGIYSIKYHEQRELMNTKLELVKSSPVHAVHGDADKQEEELELF